MTQIVNHEIKLWINCGMLYASHFYKRIFLYKNLFTYREVREIDAGAVERTVHRKSTKRKTVLY